MDCVFTEILASSFGPVAFSYDGEGVLRRIELPYRTDSPRQEGSPRRRRLVASGRRPAGAPARPAVERWLRSVAAGRDTDFPGRWEPPGRGEFQRRVYRAVKRIGAGRTRTYGEIAVHCGSPGAARAVGNAMADNPLPLLVPCHRVLAAGGLGGYGGGLDLKRQLLAAEGAACAQPQPSSRARKRPAR